LTAIITGCSAIVSAQNDSSNDHISIFFPLLH